MVYVVHKRIFALACTVVLGCPSPSEPDPGPPATEPASETFAGTVRETLAGGHYTYVRLRVADGDERWVVVTDAPDRAARRLTVRSFGTRRDFVSRRLGRTFDELHFATLIEDTKENEP